MSSGKIHFWRWLARALWREAEVVDRAVLGVSLIGSVIAFFVSRDVATEPATPWYVSLSVVVVGLLLSFAIRAYRLEKSITPTLRFGEIGYDEIEKTYFIKVHNCSQKPVIDVLVRLERFMDRSGQNIRPYIALSTRYHPNAPKDSRFSIDACSYREVFICRYDKARPDDGFDIVNYEHDSKKKWHFASGVYFLELTINLIGPPVKQLICAQMSDPPRLFKIRIESNAQIIEG